MPMLNPFRDTDAFNSVSLTLAINEFAIRYGRLTALENQLWRAKSSTTRDIAVERQFDELVILPTRPVGADPTLGKVGGRDFKIFKVPRIPHIDTALPSEVANLRAFGSESELEPFNRLVARKLDTASAKHDITFEHLLAGMLKGTVLDADGSTIYNWHTEFGVAPQTLSLELDVTTTDVRTLILAGKRMVEDGIGTNDIITGFWAPVSEGLFDAIIKHDDVKDAYRDWVGAAQRGEMLRNDPRTFFPFAGVVFEEYRARSKNPAGTITKFIADNEGYLVPLGTMNTFVVHYAPMESTDFVNTEGRRLYAKQEPIRFDMGTDILSESNPLPICTRPKSIVKLTLT